MELKEKYIKNKVGLLEQENRGDHGKNEFWIRTDGVCNIRTPKGYRRAGNLPGYPGAQANTITEYLKQDGFYAVNDGRYIYVSR